jgi:HAD superfamily hydrolase (TIGR01509 family)
VQTFVFDCFGVISSEVAPLVLEAHLPAKTVRVVKDTIIMDADRGVISQSVMFEKLAGVLCRPPKDIEEEFWSRVHIDHAVIDIIKKLGAAHKVGFLSNSPAPFVREVLARHSLAELFHTILISAEESLVKPDPAIFTCLLQRMAVRPADAVMIDDKQRNIEGAQAAGMQGLLFENAQKLAQDLVELHAVKL